MQQQLYRYREYSRGVFRNTTNVGYWRSCLGRKEYWTPFYSIAVSDFYFFVIPWLQHTYYHEKRCMLQIFAHHTGTQSDQRRYIKNNHPGEQSIYLIGRCNICHYMGSMQAITSDMSGTTFIRRKVMMLSLLWSCWIKQFNVDLHQGFAMDICID